MPKSYSICNIGYLIISLTCGKCNTFHEISTNFYSIYAFEIKRMLIFDAFLIIVLLFQYPFQGCFRQKKAGSRIGETPQSLNILNKITIRGSAYGYLS